jgi:hypothetical protein
MRLTAQLELQPSDAQADALRRTPVACNVAAIGGSGRCPQANPLLSAV